MSDDARQPTEPVTEPTEAQFTIRALFVAMAVVAVLAAIAGAIVRRVDPDTRIRLLLGWGMWLMVSLLWIAYAAHRRRAAEKLAGRALLRVPLFDEAIPHATVARRWSNVASSIILTLFMLTAFSFNLTSLPPGSIGPGIVWSFAMMGLLGVFLTSRLVTTFWWRTNVRFGELGILWDRRVMLWDHVVYCDYCDFARSRLQINGIDQNNIDLGLEVVVPQESREVLDTILKSKFVAKPAVDIKNPMNQLSRMPISDAVRDGRFLKYIGFIVIVILCFVVGGSLFSDGFTGIREFDYSVFWGFIGAGIGFPLLRALLRLRRAVLIGPPIARIATSRRWYMSLAAVAAAVGMYWIGKQFGVTSAPVAYVTGFAFGGIANAAINCLVRQPLDLRANGVYRFGAFWPWEQVRLMTWEPHRGKLVLQIGWWRLRANVLADQHNEVEGVLRQNLGLDYTPTSDDAALIAVEKP
jgi:hypothetical protein